MMTVTVNNYEKKDRDDVVATVTDHGKAYDIATVIEGDQISIHLRDDMGSTILTASVNELVDSISKNASANQKEQLAPELMTFDVTGTGASMRIIFQNASKNESTSNISYDAGMLLLIKIG